MPRVTEIDVREIMDADDLIIVSSFTPFIKAANILVNRFCDVDDQYEDDELLEIERWLAAHFTQILATKKTQERIGSVENYYQSKIGMGLKLTHYGQQALILDYHGGLAEADAASVGKRRPQILWLGNQDDKDVNFPYRWW